MLSTSVSGETFCCRYFYCDIYLARTQCQFYHSQSFEAEEFLPCNSVRYPYCHIASQVTANKIALGHLGT